MTPGTHSGTLNHEPRLQASWSVPASDRLTLRAEYDVSLARQNTNDTREESRTRLKARTRPTQKEPHPRPPCVRKQLYRAGRSGTQSLLKNLVRPVGGPVIGPLLDGGPGVGS